jgi:hypothetical protein
VLAWRLRQRKDIAAAASAHPSFGWRFFWIVRTGGGSAFHARKLSPPGGPRSYLKLPYQYPRPAASAADAADAAEASASVPAQASLAPRTKPEPALPDGELLDRVAVIRVPALSRDKGFARRYAAEGNAAVRRLAAARAWIEDWPPEKLDRLESAGR